MDLPFLAKTIQDLLDSHEELLAGVPNIVCDFQLLNECRINGETAMRQLREEIEELTK